MGTPGGHGAGFPVPRKSAQQLLPVGFGQMQGRRPGQTVVVCPVQQARHPGTVGADDPFCVEQRAEEKIAAQQKFGQRFQRGIRGVHRGSVRQVVSAAARREG
jgi:hypothetical protein